MKAAGLIVVVVEQVVLVASLGRHSTPEGGEFPRVNGRIELYREESKFCHQVVVSGDDEFWVQCYGIFWKNKQTEKYFFNMAI